MMRRPNNPMLRQIERAERRQAIREVLRLLAVLAITLVIIFLGFDLFMPAEIPTGTIVEDNRGPELRKLYEAAMKP